MSPGKSYTIKLQYKNNNYKVQFRQTNRSQSREALELKILYEQETAMRAACSNRDLMVFFAISQALAA